MTDTPAPGFSAARARFPRGLAQPPESFRFSMDALLLAAFAVRHCLPEHGPEGGRAPDGALSAAFHVEETPPECSASSLLDLGCGCGVVALACLLACPALSAAGVEIQPALAAAARENAVLLGLEDRLAVHAADISSPTPLFPSGAFAVAAANMPYRPSGSGRLPRSAARRAALFAEEGTMPAFLSFAARAVAEGGSLALVYPWDGREAVLSALAEHGFSAQEILPVRTGTDAGSRCCIRAVRVRDAAGPGVFPRESGTLRVLPPLVLRAEKGGPYTEEALAFCPWLGSRPWVWTAPREPQPE